MYFQGWLFCFYISDLNECGRNIAHCNRFANCSNERGSYTCTCIHEYVGDGFECYYKYAGNIWGLLSYYFSAFIFRYAMNWMISGLLIIELKMASMQWKLVQGEYSKLIVLMPFPVLAVTAKLDSIQSQILLLGRLELLLLHVFCFSIFLLGLRHSAILGNDDNHLSTLSNWLKPVMQSKFCYWNRCWRASLDGWASTTFHSLCDNKGPTVTIIRVGQYIFGGYTSASWSKWH